MVEINSTPRRRWRLWAAVAVVVIGLGALAVIVGPRLADPRAANPDPEWTATAAQRQAGRAITARPSPGPTGPSRWHPSTPRATPDGHGPNTSWATRRGRWRTPT